MQQELVNPTRGMVVWEQRRGIQIADVVRERYLRDGASMEVVATEMGIDISTLSRWMRRLGISARIFATDRTDR